MTDIDVQTIELNEYFNYLDDKEVISLLFIGDYFEIQFDKGYIRCMSETTIGSNTFPSKESIWNLHEMIGNKVNEVEETDNAIIITTEKGMKIILDKAMGPSGDCCHMQVNDLPTLHI